MISNDDLILYYYQDGLNEIEIQRIERALTTDSRLQARYDQLILELSQLDADDDISCPEHLKHQWHSLIERTPADTSGRSHSAPSWRSMLGWSFSFAATLMIGVAIGLYFLSDKEAKPPVVVGTPSVEEESNSFGRGLQLHLENSQAQLGRLVADKSGDKQSLVEEIIHQNRLFEQVAEAKQAPDVARVLRAFEPILLQLANEELDTKSVQALQRQLVFEMNIVLTKLSQQRSNETHTI